MKTSDPSLNGSRSSTVEKRAERAQILAKLAAEAADLRAEKCANVPDIAAALTLSRSAVNYALSARYGTAVVTSEKIVGHLRALPAPPAAQRAEYERRSACALRATKRGDRPAAAAPQPAAAPAPSALLGGATGSATFDGVFSVLSGLAMPEMFPSAYPPVRFNGGSCGNPGGPVKIPIKEMMTFLPEGEDVQETTTGDVAVLKLVRRLRELRAEMAAVREALRHVIDN